jgi:hypothetical protein
VALAPGADFSDPGEAQTKGPQGIPFGEGRREAFAKRRYCVLNLVAGRGGRRRED